MYKLVYMCIYVYVYVFALQIQAFYIIKSSANNSLNYSIYT